MVYAVTMHSFVYGVGLIVCFVGLKLLVAYILGIFWRD